MRITSVTEITEMLELRRTFAHELLMRILTTPSVILNTVHFENEILDIYNFQGNAAVNCTDIEISWTPIVEHKWFEFGKDEEGMNFQRQSSAENIVLSENLEMSLAIRLMMRRTVNYI